MRREKYITITSDNRDKDKTFYLREMSAVQAEKWAARALLAVSGPGTSIPQAGLASLADAGFNLLEMLGNIRWEVAEPLLDEMMTCEQRKESATCIRSLVPEDIDEISTIFTLRKEVLKLHLDPSLVEKFQTLGGLEAKADINSRTT